MVLLLEYQTFRSRNKAIYNVPKVIKKENRTTHLHESQGMNSTYCWIPQSHTLVGNYCSPLFYCHKLTTTWDVQLGLCCDFYLSKKTSLVFFLRSALKTWSPLESASLNSTRTKICPGTGQWPIRDAIGSHDVLEWKADGLQLGGRLPLRELARRGSSINEPKGQTKT
jgi:hypothetical protein